MFTIHEIRTERGILQYRRESLTGIRCRISPARVERQIDTAPAMPSSRDGCPFCPDAIDTSTPTFEDGSRLRCGK
ncbi:MAG: galactose-1-phosphate uridylyltransferase, partial [Methanoculleus sp.]|nr:galactose-1-phosphate uridylyltransferase [Methanoculleus sp.]